MCRNTDSLFSMQDIGLIAVGFVAAFASGLLAVKSLAEICGHEKLCALCLLPHRVRRAHSAHLGNGLGEMGLMMQR